MKTNRDNSRRRDSRSSNSHRSRPRCTGSGWRREPRARQKRRTPGIQPPIGGCCIRHRLMPLWRDRHTVNRLRRRGVGTCRQSSCECCAHIYGAGVTSFCACPATEESHVLTRVLGHVQRGPEAREGTGHERRTHARILFEHGLRVLSTFDRRPFLFAKIVRVRMMQDLSVSKDAEKDRASAETTSERAARPAE
jgi:hypothetical protein